MELKVYCPGLTLNDGSLDQFLVWDVWLGASCGTGCGSRWEEAFYMDAHTGELKGRMSLVAGLDRRVFDCSARLDDLCYSEYYDEVLHYTFGRREGAPARGPNPRYLPEISTDTDDAYDLVEGVHNYLLDRFDRNGANGQGGTGTGSETRPVTRTVVQVYREFASGAGNCPYGAVFFPDSSNISLCKDVAVPDILSHEYFHSLNHHTANLENSAESGGLNEANSFILAECFEYLHAGGSEQRRNDAVEHEVQPQILLGWLPVPGGGGGSGH